MPYTLIEDVPTADLRQLAERIASHLEAIEASIARVDTHLYVASVAAMMLALPGACVSEQDYQDDCAAIERAIAHVQHTEGSHA